MYILRNILGDFIQRFIPRVFSLLGPKNKKIVTAFKKKKK